MVVLVALLLLSAGPAQAADPQALVEAGRCAEAVQAAGDDPSQARALGDAHRCLGNPRDALLAYQRWLAAQGPDPAVATLIDGLRSQLATVRVRVELQRPAPVDVTILLPPGESVAAEPLGGAEWVARDLPVGTPVDVHVAGPGVEPTSGRTSVLRAGDEASVALRPAWRGIGSVRLSEALPAGIEAWVQGRDDPIPAGQAVPVTAGGAVVQLQGPHGAVDVPVQVGVDQIVSVDPRPWTPTGLAVADAPAGATLRFFLEGVEPPLDRSVAVPPDAGSVDPARGVRVVDAFAVDGLVGGPGSLVIEHDRLGVAAVELLLEPGAANAVTVPVDELPGLPALQARWTEWKDGRVALARKRNTPVFVSLGVAGAATVLSGIAWGVAGSSGKQVADARAAALAGTPHPTGGDWYADHQAAAASERAWTGIAVGAAGLGSVGFVVSGVFGGQAQRAMASYGDWPGR
jgi:hypothetical protein